MSVTQEANLTMTKSEFIKYILFILILCFTGNLYAQNETVVCNISYISRENVYVDKGKQAGLEVGDTLVAEKDGKITTSLLVVYIAQYSASCSIISQLEQLKVGIPVRLVKRRGKDIRTTIPTIQPKKSIKKASSKSVKSERFARINGGISFQWYHYEDESVSKLNYDQPTVRFNLKARQIFGKNYNFIMKMRLRRIQSSRNYSPYTPQDDWQNRIYNFYFSYEDLDSPVNYRIGRIISNEISGVGYIDGLLLQHNLSHNIQWGVYAGVQSEWQFAGSEFSLQKYGLYFNYLTGDYRSQRWKATIAFSTTYHGKTVSRENIYFQSSYRSGSKLSIFNSFEIDVNRSWRKEKAGDLFSLTSFYLSARYKFSNFVSSGITYDNRKNYYTYETRDLPDIVYDMAFRHGVRADLNLKFPEKYTSAIQLGIRKRQHDSESTYTGRISFNKRDLLFKGFSAFIRISGYSNYYTKGWIPSINLIRQFSNGNYISLTGGRNTFQLKLDNQHRLDQWIRINGYLQLFAKTYLSGYYGYEWGENLKTHKLLAEIGYRF
jgi:hypothetical protein